MSRLQSAAAAVAAVVLLGGLVLAYAQREAGSPVAAVVALGIGTLLAIGAAVAEVIDARDPRDLDWPDELRGSWPTSPWWWAAGAAGLVDVLAGALVSGGLGVVGVLLIGVSALGLGRDLSAATPEIGRGTVRAARRLQAAAAGSSDAAAAVTRVGSIGARVLLFEGDGRLADVVVPDVTTGELAARIARLRTVPPTEVQPPLRTT